MAQPNSYHHKGEGIGIQQQKIIILNNFGEKLVGILHETGSQELVILCHGFRSTKDDKTTVSLVDALTREGISAFRFDFAGNGALDDHSIMRLQAAFRNDWMDLSGGRPSYFIQFLDALESEGSFQYGNYRREAEDLRAVVLYFSGLKREISAILGHSKGGNVVLLYASKYRDVHTVVNICGRFALERGIEGRLGKEIMQRIKKDGFFDVKDKTGKVEYRVTEQSMMDRLTTDMHAACLSIDKDCRVLTIHGSADDIVPTEDASEFAKLIPNHKLCIIEGANHGYTAHLVELASIVLDFIKAGVRHDNIMPSQVLSCPRADRFLCSRL